jgi:hypothetical protein
MFLSCLTAWRHACADTPPSEVAVGVKQVVMGIMSYTRWPEQPPTLRLCVVGEPGYATALFAGGMQIGKTPVAVSRNPRLSGDISAHCDAIYAGPMAQTQRLSLRKNLAGHPVLTIAEDDPPCVGGSMFCLDLTRPGTTTGFAVNLDSVARSGVAVNPRVLLLGRRPKAAP